VAGKGPIFILSIDGGGSRGVIPANVLYHIEHDARVPVRETFDFFAGVSTGAMVAAYLARDAGSMETLAKHSYSSDNLSRIMDKSIWDRMLGRMQNQPKYDGENKRQKPSFISKNPYQNNSYQYAGRNHADKINPQIEAK